VEGGDHAEEQDHVDQVEDADEDQRPAGGPRQTKWSQGPGFRGEAGGPASAVGASVGRTVSASISCRRNFWTLPVAVSGKSVRRTIEKWRGTLKAARACLQWARRSSTDTAVPSLGTTTAARISSTRGSGRPTTCACSTPGWPTSTSSTSSGDTLMP